MAHFGQLPTSPCKSGAEELLGSSPRAPEQEAASQAALSVMTAEADPQLGSLTIFSKEDFEEDWVKVASGGFGCVYQVKHRRWRTVYAVKCSPYLLQDSSADR